jgi:NADPH2:quinone reductase
MATTDADAVSSQRLDKDTREALVRVARHAITSPGETTLVFGVPPQDETVALDPFDIYYRELEVVGVYALTRNTFSRAVTLLRGDRIETDPLVTDEFRLEGVQTAFDQMQNNEGLKKMVYPNGR